MLANRLVRSYLVLAIGLALFALRRLVLPAPLEAEGLPLDIVVPSVLNACYSLPSAANCSDPVIVVATTLGVVLAVGWGSIGVTLFTFILAPLPIALYFLYSPPWAVLLAFAAIPPVMEIGLRFVFPPQPLA